MGFTVARDLQNLQLSTHYTCAFTRGGRTCNKDELAHDSLCSLELLLHNTNFVSNNR